MTQSPLTVENVMRTLEGLENKWKEVGKWLRISDERLTDIEAEKSTNTERLHSVVQYWIQNCPDPTWRYLIWRLDGGIAPHGEKFKMAANKIRRCAERLADPSLTCTNVLAALDTLKTVGGNSLDWVLRIPTAVGKELQEKYNEEEQRREMVTYYLRTHPDASWEHLAGDLLYYEENSAFEKVKNYISHDEDPSLTLTKLTLFLNEVEEQDEEYIFCDGLCVPLPVFESIKNQHPDDSFQRKSALCEWYLDHHPAPSWDHFANCLYKEDEHEILQDLKVSLKDKDEEEIAEFIKGIENAIAKDGKIDRKLAHIVFVGPPGSGKSSLMDRLLGKIRKKFSASTGVCDSIVIVDIDIDNPSTFRSATVLDSQTWREIESDKSFVSQMGKESIVSHPRGEIQLLDTQGETKLQNAGQNRFSAAKASQATPSIAATATITTPFGESIDSVIKKYGFKTLKEYLKKTCSLYLRDTGGQVEFQEMLALLISGPSIFIFVFRADLDFRNRFHIQYRKNDSESLNSYTSSITTEEALLQSLASVYAMDTLSECIKSHQPLVFLVGTHIDQLVGSERAAKLADLNQHLHSIIKSNGFSDLVQYADKRKGHVMFAVDNTSEDEESFHLIRSKINHIMNRKEFSIEYPISYLLFCLDLQKIKKSVITIEECRELAANHGIIGEQVLNLLRFLHLRIGLIRYYDVEGLRHLVFVQPQVLFNKTTDLIAITFSSGSLFPNEADDLEKRGILSADAFGSLTSFSDNITQRDFLQLLVHLRIAAPLCLPGDEVERFFLPCVLNHVPESTEEDLLESNIMPLFVKFKCNHCPKGVYGVLVTHLMRPEEDDSESIFTLIEDKIFKDQVSFELSSADVLDEICLKVFPSYIEINFFPELSDLRTAPVVKVCSNVRQVIEKSIQRSLKDLHYQKEKVELVICLKCDHCTQLHPVERRNNRYILKCRKFRKTSCIPPSGRYWYNEDESQATSQQPQSQGHKRQGCPSGSSYASQGQQAAEQVSPHSPSQDTSKKHEGNCQMKCPTSSNLTLIKWKDDQGVIQRFRLMEQISDKWIEIGTLVGLKGAQLDRFKQMSLNDPMECCRRVFSYWLEEDEDTSRSPKTWDDVYSLLEDIERAVVASDLKRVVMKSAETT